MMVVAVGVVVVEVVAAVATIGLAFTACAWMDRRTDHVRSGSVFEL